MPILCIQIRAEATKRENGYLWSIAIVYCTREFCVGQKKPRDAHHGRGMGFFWSRLGRGRRQVESLMAARDL